MIRQHSTSKQRSTRNSSSVLMRLLLLLMLGIGSWWVFAAQALQNEPKPFVSGSLQQIQLQNQGKPLVVSFWSETCTHCMHELAMLGKLLKQYPDAQLVTVSTDAFLDTDIVREVMARSELQMENVWVFADDFNQRLYADVDQGWRGELPYTVLIDTKGKVKRQIGLVNEAFLQDWLKAQ